MMNQPNDEIIVSSRKRPPLARGDKASNKTLLRVALLLCLLLMAESLLLRSGLRLDYLTTFSAFDMTWYTLALFCAAFCFSVLMPKKIQLAVISIQFFVTTLILGAILTCQELPTLGLLRLIANLPGLAEQSFKTAFSSPYMLFPFVFFILKSLTALAMPPFQAKQRLPLGAILFMACCITLVPPQSATLKILTTTRTSSYKIMAMQSIQRYGYLFTWLAEQQSRTWQDCYIAPENLPFGDSPDYPPDGPLNSLPDNSPGNFHR